MRTQKKILPDFGTYVKYSSDNYGAHCLWFSDSKGRAFYFSYQTLVAFRAKGQTVCRENVWGPTTGKHLNAIEPDHSKRVNADEFDRLYDELVEK